VVIENMMCFLKLTTESDDNRYVDSFWMFDPSSILPSGSVFEADVQWMASAVNELEIDRRADASIPFDYVERRRWSSTCGCDPDRDMDETILVPVTVCRVYFRSSRRAENHYDFRAGLYLEILEDIRREELGLEPIPTDITIQGPMEVTEEGPP